MGHWRIGPWAQSGAVAMTAKLVVLASGYGSNLQAILDATIDGVLDARVAAVISDNPDAFALERARALGIPAVTVARQPGEDRAAYDTRLAEAVKLFDPAVVVLAGYTRLVSLRFLGAVSAPVVNVHPALPGVFPGLHAIEKAHAASLENGLTHTGVMIHLVPDDGVDDGPVLATARVPIVSGDTVDTLAVRIHHTEHALLVLALRNIVESLSLSIPPANYSGQP